MHHVELSYLLVPLRGRDTLIRNPLMDMLHAVREQGSIGRAASALSLSYRTVWGALKSAERALDRELIVWDKGQRARLTDFGEKLLWAERQAQARLVPQIEALRGDIEQAFSSAFDDSAHLLTLYASHDVALPTLREHALQHKLHLDLRFMGSVDAIAALNAGRCMMAGFHTLDRPGSKTVAARTYRMLLKPGLHKLIGFAHRTQGLIVARGNPLGIAGIADLVHSRHRYVNRAEGTGTRVLVDELLADAKLDSAQLRGYETQEPSHAAVAQAVASGSADAGLGIEACAMERGLGFVPLLEERYHLVCLKSELETHGVRSLLALLQSPEWLRTLDSLPGYRSENAQSGQVLALRGVLPWWNYRKPKKTQTGIA
jgi:putative molybdopterin biosynthesis protein